MSNLTTYIQTNSNLILQNMAQYKANPALVQQNILNYIQTISNGVIDIVDPTTPFVMLMEASVVNSAAAIQESNIATQSLYPSLTQTNNDLYKHMSDEDYIDIFSTPSSGVFTFLINKNEFINSALTVSGTNYSKVTIPNNSYITVAGYVFTLLYGIDILYYNNNSILIRYNVSTMNPLQTIGSFIIPHNEITDSSGTEWVTFNVTINQQAITTNEYPINNSEYFQQVISYTNLFYYCRIFYLTDPTASFVEMNVTYTDQVFDPSAPTALVQVNLQDNEITVNIPQVYVDNNLVSGTIRIDLYTTMGQLDLNLANYTPTTFTGVFTSANPEDLNLYTTAMDNISYLWYSNQIVSGGNNGITFNQLQSNIINNAVNGRLLPITTAQIQSIGVYNNFLIDKNVDMVTNREFKAIQAPPPYNNPYIIPTLNTSILPITLNTSNISTDNKIIVDGSTIILTPETLVVNQNNNTLELVTLSQRQNLATLNNSDLVNEFNINTYLYSPFYYMINTETGNLVVRAYAMNNPVMNNLNYISTNPTTGFTVSTNSFNIAKTATGYILILVVDGNSAYLGLNSNSVFCQIAFTPYGQNTYAYMTAYAQTAKGTNGGFVFVFNISSNFYFDINNTIDLDSLTIPQSPETTPRTSLSTTFTILYGTTQQANQYVPDNAQQNIFNSNGLPNTSTIITEETVNVQFGSYLSNLWIKASSYQLPGEYLTYQNDVPAYYSEPVFQKDPTTGSIFTVNPTNANQITYNLLYNVGDPVLNSDGTPVYSFYAGDPVLDSAGNPIVVGNPETYYTFDMVLYDGVYKIATDPNVLSYVQLATNTLVTWATTTMGEFTDELLEQTSIYYSPTNSNWLIECSVDGKTSVMLNSNLTPTVNVYLTNENYNNANLQNQLMISITDAFRNYLSTNTTLSKTSLLNTLSSALSNVVTLSVENFFSGYDLVTIVNPQDAFIIERINYLENSGTIGVKENLTILFFNTSQVNN